MFRTTSTLQPPSSYSISEQRHIARGLNPYENYINRRELELPQRSYNIIKSNMRNKGKERGRLENDKILKLKSMRHHAVSGPVDRAFNMLDYETREAQGGSQTRQVYGFDNLESVALIDYTIIAKLNRAPKEPNLSVKGTTIPAFGPSDQTRVPFRAAINKQRDPTSTQEAKASEALLAYSES
ncbi:hypothetical protein V2J09_012996 [Rumex salicifolius]